MSAILRFGIALYSPIREGEGRHWALVVSQPGQNTLVGKVNIYQIVHVPNSSDYQLFHKIVDDYSGAELQKSTRYYGVVDLGSLRLVTDFVFALLEYEPAEQGAYLLPQGKVWSCAWWVIRALRKLVTNHVAIKNLPASDLELYDKVVGPLATKMATAGRIRAVPME